jgi:CBS domain-containing protein
LREAILVRPDTPVRAAIEMMRQKRLGCTIVVDENGKAVGAFTERNVIQLLLQRPGDFDTVLVDHHLDDDWFVMKPSDPIHIVMDAVAKGGARFVCVADEEGRPIALTGQKGLSEYVAEHFPQQVMVQRIGGKPGMETREGA